MTEFPHLTRSMFENGVFPAECPGSGPPAITDAARPAGKFRPRSAQSLAQLDDSRHQGDVVIAVKLLEAFHSNRD